jgi:hypothetical protein
VPGTFFPNGKRKGAGAVFPKNEKLTFSDFLDWGGGGSYPRQIMFARLASVKFTNVNG